jgi:Xaa-Pro aminopeptidase
MRIKILTKSLAESDLDAYLVTRDPNIIYYAGTISGGVLAVSNEFDPVLFVPKLNLYIAQDQSDECEVRSFTKQTMFEQIATILEEHRLERIGFDELSLGNHERLGEMLSGVELVEKPDLVWEMRKVKDSKEQELMRKAGELSDIGMEAIRNCLEDGLREYEIAAEAAYAMRKEGAEDYAFPFIVASGPRSAYPHAGVSERKIRRGDFIKIDMGATYHGYRSDNTRTFVVGAPTEKQRTIYETVLEANEAALPKIIDGAAGIEVDKIARDIIKGAGYGESFIHSLGHGLGLEIHEPPSLSKRSKDTLRVGNVVSNEPGIYVKGFGGVRIEDTVLVTPSGPERLTEFDRELDAIRV